MSSCLLLMRGLPLLGLLLLLLATHGAQAAAKPLVYRADASPEGFDPALWDSASTGNVTTQIFQGLVSFQRGSATLVPTLATEWAVSGDATHFTFKLRRGVKFHSTPYFTPGRDFNTDDVIFTFTRMVDPKLPFNAAFPANFVYPQSLSLAQMIAGIDRLGDHEVRFRLHRGNVNFVAYFAASFAGIHSAEYAAQLLRQGRASAINNLIFKRERPWITMAHSSVYIPLRKDVVGFVMAPNGSVDFEGVYRP